MVNGDVRQAAVNFLTGLAAQDKSLITPDLIKNVAALLKDGE
jgi:hypothetical protein